MCSGTDDAVLISDLHDPGEERFAGFQRQLTDAFRRSSSMKNPFRPFRDEIMFLASSAWKIVMQ